MNKEHKSEIVFLIAEAAETEAMGQEFVKLGHRVIVEKNFDSAWRRLTEQTPELFVVDVVSFSQGKQNFSTHPLVAKGVVPLVVYYNQSTRPIVHTLPALFTLGEIERSPNYNSMIKRIHARLEAFQIKDHKILEKNILIKKLEEMNSDLFAKIADYTSEKTLLDGLTKCCQYLISAKNEAQNFYESLASAFENFEGVSSYSLIELGLDKSSLFGAQLAGKKCRSVNRLAIAQVCNHGLSPFAQQMAIQAYSINGESDIISLSIYLNQPNPQAMLLITPVAKFDRQFVWEILEDVISNYYWRCFSSSQTASTLKEDNLNPAEFMDKVERDSGLSRLIEVNLTSLLLLAMDKSNGDVVWTQLQTDLLTRLKSNLPVGANFSTFGIDKIYFSVERAEFDSYYAFVQSTLAKFPYWKYFSKLDFNFSKSSFLEAKELHCNQRAVLLSRLHQSELMGSSPTSPPSFELEN